MCTRRLPTIIVEQNRIENIHFYLSEILIDLQQTYIDGPDVIKSFMLLLKLTLTERVGLSTTYD